MSFAYSTLPGAHMLGLLQKSSVEHSVVLHLSSSQIPRAAQHASHHNRPHSRVHTLAGRPTWVGQHVLPNFLLTNFCFSSVMAATIFAFCKALSASRLGLAPVSATAYCVIGRIEDGGGGDEGADGKVSVSSFAVGDDIDEFSLTSSCAFVEDERSTSLCDSDFINDPEFSMCDETSGIGVNGVLSRELEDDVVARGDGLVGPPSTSPSSLSVELFVGLAARMSPVVVTPMSRVAMLPMKTSRALSTRARKCKTRARISGFRLGQTTK